MLRLPVLSKDTVTNYIEEHGIAVQKGDLRSLVAFQTALRDENSALQELIATTTRDAMLLLMSGMTPMQVIPGVVVQILHILNAQMEADALAGMTVAEGVDR